MKKTCLQAPALFIALVLFTGAVQAQQKTEIGSKEPGNNINVSAFRSAGSDETNIDYTEDGQKFKVRLHGSRIIEMYIDGKKVPEGDFPKYELTVKTILEQIEKDRKEAEKDRIQAEVDRAKAVEVRELVERDRSKAQEDRRQAEKDREQAHKEREQAEKDRAQAEHDRQQAAIDRKKAEEDRIVFNAMIDELITEKLVESRATLTSLEMDDTKLIINGKAQPESVHTRYKEKYLKRSHHRMSYRNTGGTRNISMD